MGADFDASGTNHMSFGGWFTPRDDSGDYNTYVFYRSAQFYLRYDGPNQRIAAGLNVGAQQYEIYSPDGSCLENSRNFVMVVYDGATLKMYHAQLKSPTVVAEAEVSGNVDACANDVLFAEDANVVIAEFMLWTRALGAQEVQELYFFPLARLVKKGAAATTWTLSIDASPPSMGTTDPEPDSYEIPDGEDIEVEALCRQTSLTTSFTSGSYDGVQIGSDNPVTIDPEEVGTSHSLVAVFRWRQSNQLPPSSCGVMGVIDGGSTTPPSITEVAAATTTPTASNSMSESSAATTTTTAGETISEAPTQRAESHLITYVGAATSTGNDTTSGNFSLPAGWAAGDVAICWWYTRSSSKTFTKPAAVTQLQNSSSSYPGRLFVGYRVLVAGDTTFAWTSSSVANSDVIWGTSVYHGTHASTPIDSESGAPD